MNGTFFHVTARALAVLAHEAWHLRRVRNEGRTECYALQAGVEIGQRLGLSRTRSTAERAPRTRAGRLPRRRLPRPQPPTARGSPSWFLAGGFGHARSHPSSNRSGGTTIRAPSSPMMANSSFACSSWRRKLGFRRAQALAHCVETRSVLCRLRRLASGLPDTHCLLDQPAAFRAGRDPPCLSDQLAPLLASRSADGVPNHLPSRRTGCKPDRPAKRRRHEQTLASERPPNRVARPRHAPRWLR